MEYTNKVCRQGSANENGTVVGVIDFKLEQERVVGESRLVKVECAVYKVVCIKNKNMEMKKVTINGPIYDRNISKSNFLIPTR